MTTPRRLSQAISEGDGISLIVPVTDSEGARAAQEAGAEGLLVRSEVSGIREATSLPLLQIDSGGDADACVLWADALEDEEVEQRYESLLARDIECVVEVRDGDDLEMALERLDPDIFLLSPGPNDESPAAAAERVLDLLPDIPAGKLAIAHLLVTTREEVDELERTGFDAVTIGTDDVAGLASAAPPEV
jgi:indole-3-glycerol phosphate synthase